MSDLSNVSLTAIQDELFERGYVAVPLDDLTEAELVQLAHRKRRWAKQDMAHAAALEVRNRPDPDVVNLANGRKVARKFYDSKMHGPEVSAPEAGNQESKSWVLM